MVRTGTPKFRVSSRKPLLPQAPIDRLNKHVRGPRARVRTVPLSVSLCGIRSLDLIERHVLLDHVLHDVAHDRDHVPIVDDFGAIADPAMAWNDRRAAFLPHERRWSDREAD